MWWRLWECNMIKQWEADQRVLWYEAETLSFPRKIKELYDDVAQQAPNEAQRVVFFISEHVAKSASSRILFLKTLVSPLAKHWVPFWRFITQQQEKHRDIKWYQMISPHLTEQQGLTAPRIWAKSLTVGKCPLQHANTRLKDTRASEYALNKFVHSVWWWGCSKSARTGVLRATLPEIKMFIIDFKREVKSRHPAPFSIFKSTLPFFKSLFSSAITINFTVWISCHHESSTWCVLWVWILTVHFI